MSEGNLILDLGDVLSFLGFLCFLIFLVSLFAITYNEIHRKNNADMAKSSFSVFYCEVEKDSETGEHYGANITEYTGFEDEEEAYEFFLRNRLGSKYDYYLIHERINIK
ncbi:MAG: hypothetical protein AB4063_12475 [Crocosphaera sp.]